MLELYEGIPESPKILSLLTYNFKAFDEYVQTYFRYLLQRHFKSFVVKLEIPTVCDDDNPKTTMKKRTVPQQRIIFKLQQ